MTACESHPHWKDPHNVVCGKCDTQQFLRARLASEDLSNSIWTYIHKCNGRHDKDVSPKTNSK